MQKPVLFRSFLSAMVYVLGENADDVFSAVALTRPDALRELQDRPVTAAVSGDGALELVDMFRNGGSNTTLYEVVSCDIACVGYILTCHSGSDGIRSALAFPA